MSEKAKIYDFFLGANTADGFVSFFDEIENAYTQGFRSYVIKGGPGTGKSTFMRKAAALAEVYEPWVELIHCSSDPNSLDGVIMPEAKVSIVDGTPPHIMEPRYPGAYERVVNFCQSFDNEGLERDKEELFYVTAVNQSCHKQCVRLLSAAKSLLYDNYLTALAATDAEKVMRTAYRVFLREFKDLNGKDGVEHRRLLSAVTPEGIVFYRSTITENFSKIYCLVDPYGASSSIFMAALKDLLLSKGADIFVCPCPLDPYGKIDHILVPERGIAFITVNNYLYLPENTETHNIHFNRFTDMDLIAAKKQRIRFGRRLADEILNEAARTMKKAKTVHDSMEEIYKRHVNFEMIDELYQKTASEIVKRYENL